MSRRLRDPPFSECSTGSASRKKFSPQEDASLTLLVRGLGSSAWDAIAAQMPGRNARQCRERWKHYLSIGCADRPWTEDEDRRLVSKERQLGPRWTKLATFFDQRSDIQVKLRWTRLMSRKTEPAAPPPDPPKQETDIIDITPCGIVCEQSRRFDQVRDTWEALFRICDPDNVQKTMEFTWF
jgi:hypothetical protein